MKLFNEEFLMIYVIRAAKQDFRYDKKIYTFVSRNAPKIFHQ